VKNQHKKKLDKGKQEIANMRVENRAIDSFITDILLYRYGDALSSQHEDIRIKE
jgi:hypothetical protein